MSEDVERLILALRSKVYHLFFVEFWHYDSIRELKSQIASTYPNRRSSSIDFSKADFEEVKQFLLKNREGIIYLENFHELLKDENDHLRVYINQRRDAMAENPAAYIAFVSGDDKMRELPNKLPDQWSFRQLVVELPVPEKWNKPTGKRLSIVKDSGGSYGVFSVKEARHLEKRWKELVKEKDDEQLTAVYFSQLNDEWSRQPNPSKRLRKLESLNQWLIENTGKDEFLSQKSTLLNNLGHTFNELGDGERAIELFDSALSLDRELFGEKSTQVSRLLNNMGAAMNGSGRFEEAVKYYTKALDVDFEIGDQNGAVIHLNNLGDTWNNLAEFEKAIATFNKALKILETEGLDTSALRPTILNNLGLALLETGELNQAVSCFEESLLLGRQIYGNSHPEIAIWLNSLGLAHEKKGNYQKALEYFEHSLALIRQAMGDYHPNVANAHNNVGAVLESMDRHDEAIENYHRALEIDIKIFGEDHPAVAKELNNLGVLFIKIQDYSRAVEYLEKAFKTVMQFLGEKHPKTVMISESLEFARQLSKAQSD